MPLLCFVVHKIMNGLELYTVNIWHYKNPRTKNVEYPVAALFIDPVVNFACRIVCKWWEIKNGLVSLNGGASSEKELISALEV